jgi:hypothetical protein
MKLISENVVENTGDLIVESFLNEANEKQFKIKGIFMQAEKKNGNGRVYSLAEMTREVQNYQTIMSSGTVNSFGELDHPPRSTVDIAEVSHKMISLSMDGNNVIGEALILDTPKGKIVKEFFKAGGKLGVSSRGLGNVKTGGLVENFKLITIDIVTNPSAPDAWVNGVLESKVYSLNESGDAVEIDLVEQRLSEIESSRKEIEDTILSKFDDILSDLK